MNNHNIPPLDHSGAARQFIIANESSTRSSYWHSMFYDSWYTRIFLAIRHYNNIPVPACNLLPDTYSLFVRGSRSPTKKAIALMSTIIAAARTFYRKPIHKKPLSPIWCADGAIHYYCYIVVSSISRVCGKFVRISMLVRMRFICRSQCAVNAHIFSVVDFCLSASPVGRSPGANCAYCRGRCGGHLLLWVLCCGLGKSWFSA